MGFGCRRVEIIMHQVVKEGDRPEKTCWIIARSYANTGVQTSHSRKKFGGFDEKAWST